MEYHCKTCDLDKTRDLFPKGATHIYKCNSCIAEIYRRKTSCEICEKLISYSNMSKHMFVHNHNSLVCGCGKVVKEHSLPKHKKSKKHIFEMEILNEK
jgi:hypothetical protein